MTRTPGASRKWLLLLFLLPGPALMCCDHPDYGLKSVVDAELPLIRKLTPTVLIPNQILAIEGSGFGAREGQIYVTDEREKTIGPLAIESWSDEAIDARIPDPMPFDLEGILKLATADSRAMPFSPVIRIVGPSGPR